MQHKISTAAHMDAMTLHLGDCTPERQFGGSRVKLKAVRKRDGKQAPAPSTQVIRSKKQLHLTKSDTDEFFIQRLCKRYPVAASIAPEPEIPDTQTCIDAEATNPVADLSADWLYCHEILHSNPSKKRKHDATSRPLTDYVQSVLSPRILRYTLKLGELVWQQPHLADHLMTWFFPTWVQINRTNDANLSCHAPQLLCTGVFTAVPDRSRRPAVQIDPQRQHAVYGGRLLVYDPIRPIITVRATDEMRKLFARCHPDVCVPIDNERGRLVYGRAKRSVWIDCIGITLSLASVLVTADRSKHKQICRLRPRDEVGQLTLYVATNISSFECADGTVVKFEPVNPGRPRCEHVYMLPHPAFLGSLPRHAADAYDGCLHAMLQEIVDARKLPSMAVVGCDQVGQATHMETAYHVVPTECLTNHCTGKRPCMRNMYDTKSQWVSTIASVVRLL